MSEGCVDRRLPGDHAVICGVSGSPPSQVPAKRVVSPRGPGRSALPATPRRVTRAWGPPQEGMYEAATVAGPLARKLLL